MKIFYYRRVVGRFGVETWGALVDVRSLSRTNYFSLLESTARVIFMGTGPEALRQLRQKGVGVWIVRQHSIDLNTSHHFKHIATCTW
jgi:hypothetical protein